MPYFFVIINSDNEYIFYIAFGVSVLEKPPYSDEFYEVMLENEITLQNEFGITDVKVCHLKTVPL